SQPFIVAVMTQLLRVNKTGKVLEVGTGSGYQTAVLCELADFVYTTEIIEPLGLKADETLRRLGYKNFELRIGDGYGGWEENAPFDGIILTAAPDHIPQPLVRQLKSGARLILPVGGNIQELTVITKTGEGLITEKILPVKFVRMTGEAEESSSL
ncbi:MAG: protein-L-isoaspartate O-methyltransferase, partial [candidate division Zixibacteria bacterium]|nr:protein-L-isoaspartate O-methyltransferase [candidate division Zixibacteria bacterium]